MTFIDAHCHLPKLNHQTDLEDIIRAAGEWDVLGYINIGTSLTTNTDAIEVAEAYKAIYATVGIYPHEHRGEDTFDLLTKLEAQAKSSSKVVAIGECGVDLTEWKNGRSLEDQLKLFALQVRLALKLNLPVIVHTRNGDVATLAVLLANPGVRGVVHCFDATWEVAEKFLALGFYLSFSGNITYASKHYLTEVVAKVPLDRLVVETDAPYLLPEPTRTELRTAGTKRKNEPKYVRMVGQKVAEVKGISLDEVADQTCANTRRLFRFEA